MEKYAQIGELSAKAHKRLTGVSHATFACMASIYKEHQKKTRIKAGRPAKLTPNDQILMFLEYYREYRTFFHIGKSYGLSEANVYRTVRKIENILIKSRRFSLPGKKALLASDNEIEEIVLDATESKIERPKKNNGATIPPKRNNII